MKVLVVLISLFLFLPAYSDDGLESLNTQLSKVEKELEKTNGYIESGNSSNDLKKLKRNLENQVKSLKDRIMAIEETQRLAAEKLAAEKLAVERKAAEKLAAERKAAEKQAVERKATEKLAAERKAAEKRAAERKAAEKRAAEKRAAELQAQKILTSESDPIVKEKSSGEKTEADRSYEVSSNFSATTDYVFRGVTQTNNSFAIQGGFDLSAFEGASAGVWASNISGGTEVDLYAGYEISFTEEFSLSVQYIYYHYIKNGLLDTHEYGLGLNYLGYGLNFLYTADYFGTDSNSWYLSISRTVDFKKHFGVDFEYVIGLTTVDQPLNVGFKDYLDYRFSIIKELSEYSISLNWTDTDRDFVTATTKTDAEDHSLSIAISKEF